MYDTKAMKLLSIIKDAHLQKSEEGVELGDLEGASDSSRLKSGGQSVEAYFDPVADSLLKYYRAFHLEEA